MNGSNLDPEILDALRRNPIGTLTILTECIEDMLTRHDSEALRATYREGCEQLARENKKEWEEWDWTLAQLAVDERIQPLYDTDQGIMDAIKRVLLTRITSWDSPTGKVAREIWREHSPKGIARYLKELERTYQQTGHDRDLKRLCIANDLLRGCHHMLPDV